MSNILIIDDEPQIRRFLRIGLGSQGYRIFEAENGVSGLQQAVLCSPHLIILDLGLPDRDGMEVLKSIREVYQGPVIILSVRNREEEKVNALDNGANDYVVKPFGIQELLARIRALLRSSDGSLKSFAGYDDGTLTLDVAAHKVSFDGRPVHLSPKEFDLLQLLMQHQDRVLTQRQILGHLWGNSHMDDTHYLRILVKKLRNKLNDDAGAPRYIETEPGVGYRFISAGHD